MTTKDEALKLALEALESVKHKIDSYQVNVCDDVDEAITAIREALAEQPAQQQEPVAWITQNGKGWLRWHKPEDNNTDSVPLYTSPPASKPWVGLTEEDILRIKGQFKGTLDVQFDKFSYAIETTLREKNHG